MMTSDQAGARPLRAGLARKVRVYVARLELSELAREAIRDGVDRRHWQGRRKSSDLVDRTLRDNRRLLGMSARLFDKGRDAYNTKAISWTGDTQKALLVDATASTGSALKLVTAASNASPVVYTCSNGFSNNDVCVTGGIGGNLSANQTGLITSVSGTTFSLNTLEGNVVAGSGAYTSGGYALDLTLAQYVTDILGNRVGTDPTIAGTSSSRGTANATSPITWSNVPGGNPAQFIVFYNASGGSDATNKVVFLQDGKVRVVTVGDTPLSSTTMKVQPLRGQLWDGTTGSAPVMYFSNGYSATLSAAAAQGADTLSVSSTGHDIPDQQAADVAVFGGGLPVTPSGGNISFTIGTIYGPTNPTGLYTL